MYLFDSAVKVVSYPGSEEEPGYETTVLYGTVEILHAHYHQLNVEARLS